MSNELEQRLIQKASAIGTPIKATLELLPLCNMNCAMCYIHQSISETEREGGILPVSYWTGLIPEMKEMGVLFVALIGGEPLMYPGIEILWESLYRNGFYINLTTNATLLAAGIPEWLKMFPPRYITVSVYGASDETYQRITGDSAGYTRMHQGLMNLLEQKIPVKLNYIVLPENRDDFEAVMELKDKYQLPITATAYCFPKIRTSDNREYTRLSPQECAQQELRIKKIHINRNFRVGNNILPEILFVRIR